MFDIIQNSGEIAIEILRNKEGREEMVKIQV